MAEREAAQATAEAPAEEQQKGKLAMFSARGIGLLALLLLAEALALLAVVKATGLGGGTAKVASEYIPFKKVSATVHPANKQAPVFYSLQASLEVEKGHKPELERLINTNLQPLFIDRVMARMGQVPPSGERQMGLDKLRSTLKRDLRAIFNRELLKIEKYQKMYKEEIEKYKAMSKDPRQKGQAVQPGPIKDIVFTEFNF